jgi:chemotaxis protein MotB
MGRRKKKEEPEGADGFMVLFTTLSLILLAFFIFMKTLSTPDDDRQRRAMASIRRAFEWLSLGGAYPDLETTEVTSLSISNQESAYRRLERDLVDVVRRQSLGASDDVTVIVNDEEVRIRMSESILFRPGVPVINPRSFPLLDRVGSFLRTLERSAMVEGHGDPRGGELNWEISALRAAAVARYFKESTDVPGETLRSRGVAHHRPPQEEAPNLRRVEVVLPNEGDPS